MATRKVSTPTVFAVRTSGKSRWCAPLAYVVTLLCLLTGMVFAAFGRVPIPVDPFAAFSLTALGALVVAFGLISHLVDDSPSW